MNEFSDVIAAARAARGWSQDKLAEVSGVTQSTIDRIEKGGGSKHTITVMRALDIPVPQAPGAAPGVQALPNIFQQEGSDARLRERRGLASHSARS